MTATTDTIVPSQWYQQMRRHAPLYYSAKSNIWFCFTYRYTQSVFANPRIFSARNALDTEGKPIAAGLMMQDEPRHREIRNLLYSWFTPKAILDLAPRIHSIAQCLLDKVIARREMELLQDFARPLPALIVIEHLGFPPEDCEMIYNLLQEQTTSTIIAYFSQLIEQRRKIPQNDLLTTLLRARIDGQPLAVQEIIDVVGQTLKAGSDTTTHLIGNCFYLFTEYPSLVKDVQTEPELIPGLLEEVLRWYPPFPRTRRRANCDIELGGQIIRKDQLVDCLIDSANRDEEQFITADVFDMRRMPNRHLSFGYGNHFCIGAALARLEGRIALKLLLEHLPNLSIQRTGQLAPQSMVLRGVKALSITW